MKSGFWNICQSRGCPQSRCCQLMVQVYIACHWGWVGCCYNCLSGWRCHRTCCQGSGDIRVTLNWTKLDLKTTNTLPVTGGWVCCYNCLSGEEMPQNSAVKALDSRETNLQVTLNRPKKYEHIACHCTGGIDAGWFRWILRDARGRTHVPWASIYKCLLSNKTHVLSSSMLLTPLHASDEHLLFWRR